MHFDVQSVFRETHKKAVYKLYTLFLFCMKSLRCFSTRQGSTHFLHSLRVPPLPPPHSVSVAQQSVDTFQLS